MKIALAFGAGVQTTALLVLVAQSELPGFDEVIEAEGECVTGSCFV